LVADLNGNCSVNVSLGHVTKTPNIWLHNLHRYYELTIRIIESDISVLDRKRFSADALA